MLRADNSGLTIWFPDPAEKNQKIEWRLDFFLNSFDKHRCFEQAIQEVWRDGTKSMLNARDLAEMQVTDNERLKALAAAGSL